MTEFISKSVADTMQLFDAGKMLSAAALAYEAKQRGDMVPERILMQQMENVASSRARVLDALPHDTFKCPHSH
jgi:hypothetical protein